MVFCEIVYAICYTFLSIILEICTCQLFWQPQESQDLYILVALVDDKENFPTYIAQKIISKQKCIVNCGAQ